MDHLPHRQTTMIVIVSRRAGANGEKDKLKGYERFSVWDLMVEFLIDMWTVDSNRSEAACLKQEIHSMHEDRPGPTYRW